MLSKIRKYDLEIVVFVCGAVVMVFELIGSRTMAPYVGTSTYVWTSLIGVILGSLSAGYYLGGRLADIWPFTKPLSIIIFISAVAIFFSTIIKDFVSLTAVVLPFSIEIKSLIISVVLFAPASFLLGMVSPYAVRLRMKEVEKAGAASGNLYAISTLGSIVGTFVAGFYLIPRFGSFFSLFALSFILIFTALFLVEKEIRHFFSKKFLSFFLPFLIFFIVYPVAASVFRNKNFVADLDTEYNRIYVNRGVRHFTSREIISLSTDPFGTQAAIFIDDPDELVFEYTKFFKMAEAVKPDAKDALMIGGGVYTYPRDFLKNFTESTMDVVEIDPGMTEVAKKYFGLKDDPRMNIIHQDGRIYLNGNQKKYDVIFLDAFNSFSSIPFQLTTVESVRKISESLKDDGVVFANIISSIDGDKGKFFRAEYATYKNVFPNVYVFTLNRLKDGSAIQNVMLVATKEKKPIDFFADSLLAEYSEKLWTHAVADDVPILTDDFAPVEFYKRMAI